MTCARTLAVIGGGISGLAAAYFASKLLGTAAEIRVFEAGDRPGGKVATLRTEDFYVELGPDSLVASKPAAIDLAVELGLSEELVSPAPLPAFIYWAGRLHPIPNPARLGTFARSGLFSLPGRARILLDLVLPPRRDEADESVGAFFARRLGREVAERYADPLFAGLYSADIYRLSLLALFPQYREIEKHYGSLVRGLGAVRRQAAEAGGLRSLRGGLERLVEALVGRLGPDRVRLRSAAEAVLPAGDGRWLVRMGGESFAADAVILAVPAPRAAELLADAAPSLAGFLRRQELVSVGVVVFGYRGDPGLAGTGFLVPARAGLLVNGATWSSVKWPGSARSGWTVIRAYVGRAGGAAWWEFTDEELAGRVWAELGQVARLPAKPQFVFVRRWPEALPQYGVGHPGWVGQVDRELEALPGLFLAGASYRGIGLADLIRQAGEVAARAAAYVSPGPVTAG
jgi:oxygen-dependent protoporphyrinogen oxidase